MCQQSFNGLSVAFGALFLSAAYGAENPRVHQYSVTIDPGLKVLAVEARIQGRTPSLRAADRAAAGSLMNARLCNSGKRLSVRRGRIAIGAVDDPCVRYEYALKDRLSGPGWMGSSAIIDRMTSPAEWLWRPALKESSEIQVHFRLPPGIRASVPWEPLGEGIDNTYRFAWSPGSSSALVAFGAFEHRDLKVPGAVLRVSFLRGGRPMNNEKIARWLEAAATNVSLAYGRFPNPSPQVIIVPVGERGGEAVPFGRVIRDGGEAVQFFVDQTRPLEDFIGDWTATHEFSHLMLPYVHQKWISEGFATYYQNVLMARGGAYSEQRAWQKLYEGFERGRKSAPRTSPNDARMSRGGLMKIYWSGAAVALLADIRLREQSAGRQSLDSVLAELQDCCLPAARSWQGRELFAQLDKFASHPVFVELYNQYADAPGFPKLAPWYRQLGIEVHDGRVRLSNNAALSDTRRKIMSPAGS